jgi:hypothetical protein
MILVKLKKKVINSYDIAFWLLLCLGIIFITLSFPMMKMRFDIWQHIDHIHSYVLDPNTSVTNRAAWLKLWAFVFRFFNINDIFTYAIIIHRIQFALNCVLIYFAAKLFFMTLLKFDVHESKFVKNKWLSSLALSSVFVWLTIIGTYSYFQQAWIMWYSVNYQITLSMLFLALSLSVNALMVRQNAKFVILKALTALALIIGVYVFHAGELAYLCLYIFIYIICFYNIFKYNLKLVMYVIIFLSFILYVLITMYSDHTPALIALIKNEEYARILNEIQTKGRWNAIEGGNRFSANWNELYQFSVLAFIPIIVLGWCKLIDVNLRVLYFIGLSLVFCFIPTFQYTAGIASLISYDGIVNRYYFASLIFLILPMSAYFVIMHFKTIRHPLNLLMLVFFTMLTILMYSKKINDEGVYFKNVQSISRSIKMKKIDIGVSDAFIESTGFQIGAAESKYINTRFIYCGSFESLYITRYIYGKKNMLFDRLADFSIAECENHAKNHDFKIAYLN